MFKVCFLKNEIINEEALFHLFSHTEQSLANHPPLSPLKSAINSILALDKLSNSIFSKNGASLEKWKNSRSSFHKSNLTYFYTVHGCTTISETPRHNWQIHRLNSSSTSMLHWYTQLNCPRFFTILYFFSPPGSKSPLPMVVLFPWPRQSRAKVY